MDIGGNIMRSIQAETQKNTFVSGGCRPMVLSIDIEEI
jgi:hypothetical protein